MDTQFVERGEDGFPHSIEFSGYRISGARSLKELFGFRQFCLAKHPGHQVLLVIDDPSQAFYQAAHKMNSAFKSSHASTAHLKAMLRVNAPLHSLAEIEANKFLEIGAAETELDIYNRDPARGVAGENAAILVHSDDPLHGFLAAAQGDVYPVYLYIEHMVKTHGLEFAGLGATYLYFETGAPLSAEKAAAISESLARFHDDYDASAAAAMTEAMTGNSYVILTFRNW